MTIMTIAPAAPASYDRPALVLLPPVHTPTGRACEQCQARIGAGAASPRARRGRRFCSDTCATLAARTRTRPPCAAPNCDQPARRRFCSDDCQRAGHRAERTTETADYLGMAKRIVRTAGNRVGADLDELAALAAIAAEVDKAMRTAVANLRDGQGYSWAQVGDALGISRQGAQQRFGK